MHGSALHGPTYQLGNLARRSDTDTAANNAIDAGRSALIVYPWPKLPCDLDPGARATTIAGERRVVEVDALKTRSTMKQIVRLAVDHLEGDLHVICSPQLGMESALADDHDAEVGSVLRTPAQRTMSASTSSIAMPVPIPGRTAGRIEFCNWATSKIP